jgi:cullin-associated NEDD8-dissociated protein 1
LTQNAKSQTEIVGSILPVSLTLLESSTLQGACLKSFCALLIHLVPSVGFSKLLESVLAVLSKMKGTVSKQIFVNIGKCVASLASKAVEKEFKTTIEKFIKDIPAKDESTKLLALFTLGEIGISADLTSYKSLKGDIESCFDSGSEEVKTAASTSLGHITVGSMDVYLPSLLDSIKNDVKKRYLLLHSLKEVISQAPAEKLKNVIKDVVPLLFSNCDNEEEGIRNVVAECLGKLATVEYKTVIDQLKAKLDDKSEEVKSTIISAVKFTITEKVRPFDNLLKGDIAKFLRASLNKKEHHKVRRAGVLLLTSAIHTKTSLVVDRLGDLLPNLYANSITDESLIRKVDVGPFKIDVDDGLDLRKSVFECMDTVLECCVSRIDSIKFASNLPHGLNDINPDIKMLSHMMLIKLAEVAPSAVLTVVDDLCDPLKDTLNAKLKENAVQTEKERHNDMIKSALKTIYTVGQVKGVQDSIKFTDLINKVVKTNSNLDLMYESIASGKVEKME